LKEVSVRSWKAMCVLGALAVLGLAWGQRAETKGNAADEIARLLEKHKGDFLKGDADAWAALYAEDATFIGGQRNLQSRRAIKDSFAQGFKDFPARTADESNIRIRVYNEATGRPTAVLNGDVKSTRTDASGRLVNANNRESLVWAKLQGKWLIVNHQNSPIE
jgi:uncharacterized protein (TIGR02246 family)